MDLEEIVKVAEIAISVDKRKQGDAKSDKKAHARRCKRHEADKVVHKSDASVITVVVVTAVTENGKYVTRKAVDSSEPLSVVKPVK